MESGIKLENKENVEPEIKAGEQNPSKIYTIEGKFLYIKKCFFF